jgi:hypothetical protein
VEWGAVVEVELAHGLRYIHWVGASWHCDLVRVLPGLLDTRLSEPDLAVLIAGAEAYKMHVFLRDILREPNVRVVQTIAPTAAQQVVPAMRLHPRAVEGNPDAWHLFDEYTGPQPPPKDGYLQLEISGAEFATRHPEADPHQIIPWSIPMSDTFLHMLEIDWRPEQATGKSIFGCDRTAPGPSPQATAAGRAEPA